MPEVIDFETSVGTYSPVDFNGPSHKSFLRDADIALMVIGVLPGFWLLNHLGVHVVGGFPDPFFFSSPAMIGVIALSGIVTRNSIIIVDFVHLALSRGRLLIQALVESCAVRLRPILLTSA